MLNLQKVHQAIQAKASSIKYMRDQSNAALKLYLKTFEKFTTCSIHEFNQNIKGCTDNFAGALLTSEFEKGLIHSCLNRELTCSEDVSVWKAEILKDRVTAATDGSQIEPDKNLGLFFGAVQTGWFINYHAEKPPVKNIEFEIVLPSTSAEDDYELRQEVSFQRFRREVEKLTAIINTLGKQSFTKLPVAFFDGSLTVSFISSESRRREYQKLIKGLLNASSKHKIPVVGYIDTSLAFNLSRSLEQVYNLQSLSDKVSDSTLISHFTHKWGERTAFLEYFEKTDEESGLGFCYLKACSRRKKPCRLEIPMWVYEAGLMNEVANVVLAECLIGNGFPYPIEVADSIAVIQHAEREAFYDYLEKQLDLGLGQSLKLRSKTVRRKPAVVL